MKKKKQKLLGVGIAIVVILSFSGCGESESSSDNTITDDSRYFKSEVSIHDSTTDLDSQYNFMNIDSADVNITDTNVRIELNIVNIPDSLIFNRALLADGYIDYYWRIVFDIDNSDSKTQDDLAFSIENTKRSGESEVTGDILSNTQQIILEITSESTATHRDDISSFITIQNNTMIFDVPKTIYPVNKIKSYTGIRIETYHNDGDSTFYDTYPNLDF